VLTAVVEVIDDAAVDSVIADLTRLREVGKCLLDVICHLRIRVTEDLFCLEGLKHWWFQTVSDGQGISP